MPHFTSWALSSFRYLGVPKCPFLDNPFFGFMYLVTAVISVITWGCWQLVFATHDGYSDVTNDNRRPC